MRIYIAAHAPVEGELTDTGLHLRQHLAQTQSNGACGKRA